MNIPAEALSIVPPGLHDPFERDLRERKWMAALWRCSSEQRIDLCAAIWDLIPEPDKPVAFANAVSDGDNPGRMLWWLEQVLGNFHDDGIVAFDGEEARKAFDALPDTVTIYRGTVEAEADEYAYGACWTLDREKAVWFAAEHGRFRNISSPPVILSTTVPKSDIGGLLFDRKESEVLICPEFLRDVQRSDP